MNFENSGTVEKKTSPGKSENRYQNENYEQNNQKNTEFNINQNSGSN